MATAPQIRHKRARDMMIRWARKPLDLGGLGEVLACMAAIPVEERTMKRLMKRGWKVMRFHSTLVRNIMMGMKK